MKKSLRVALVSLAAPILLLAGCGTTNNSSQGSAAAKNAATANVATSSTNTKTTSLSTAPTNAPLLAVVSPAKEGPCIVSDQYKRGDNVIFRIQIIDPTTGKQLTGSDLSNVSIVLPNNQSLSAKYGTHEGSTQKFWVAHWAVPKNFPTGRVDYKVAVKGSHRTVKRIQFAVPDKDAHLTIVS